MRATSNRPTWTQESDGIFTLGQYTVELDFAGTKYPWAVRFRGRMLQRPHGTYTGYQRFMSSDNAKRWVESRRG